MKKRNDLFSSSKEQESFEASLKKMKTELKLSWEDAFLAKGELHGSHSSLGRTRSSFLKGVGFNLDYADEEGPQRDLKTGRSAHFSKDAVPLLKEGDLLVTTGLDGVFPAGFLVGVVSSVSPLQEGNYAYELEAKPIVDHLNDLHTLFVLPSLSTE